MNMFKKNGGFTLVELIVVIAILAILAAVAVPAYSGYIQKANNASDTTALGAVKTAAMGAMAETGIVDQIDVKVGADGKMTEVIAYYAVVDPDTGAITGYTAYPTLYSSLTPVNNTPWLNGDFAMYVNNTVTQLKGDLKTTGARWTSVASEWVALPASN